jgi:carbamoyl-phosphate synthase small subunit
MEGADLVREVTCESPFEWHADSLGEEDHAEFGVTPGARASRRLRVAAYDFGVKFNILRPAAGLRLRRARVSRHGACLGPLAIEPDGVFLSNGPGDPAALAYAIENVRTLTAVRCADVRHLPRSPDSGLAVGGETFKLKFGHRGANHPVKELRSGKVEITSQNHGFAVKPESLPSDTTVTHLNLYDGTVEGFRHVTRPIFSVQYHPEASPGPHDADYLFQQFSIDENDESS